MEKVHDPGTLEYISIANLIHSSVGQFLFAIKRKDQFLCLATANVMVVITNKYSYTLSTFSHHAAIPRNTLPLDMLSSQIRLYELYVVLLDYKAI